MGSHWGLFEVEQCKYVLVQLSPEQTRGRQSMPGEWFQLPRIGDTPTQLKPSTIPEFWVCFVQYLPERVCIHFQCRVFDFLFQLRRVHLAHTQLWALSCASGQDKQIHASMLSVWPSWRWLLYSLLPTPRFLPNADAKSLRMLEIASLFLFAIIPALTRFKVSVAELTRFVIPIQKIQRQITDDLAWPCPKRVWDQDYLCFNTAIPELAETCTLIKLYTIIMLQYELWHIFTKIEHLTAGWLLPALVPETVMKCQWLVDWVAMSAGWEDFPMCRASCLASCMVAGTLWTRNTQRLPCPRYPSAMCPL